MTQTNGKIVNVFVYGFLKSYTNIFEEVCVSKQSKDFENLNDFDVLDVFGEQFLRNIELPLNSRQKNFWNKNIKALKGRVYEVLECDLSMLEQSLLSFSADTQSLNLEKEKILCVDEGNKQISCITYLLK